MKRSNKFFKIFDFRSTHQFLLLVVISFSLIAFTGCGSDNSTSTSGPSNEGNNEEPMNEQGPNEVWMQGSSFNVSNLQVSAGTTVTWTNTSSVDHTVTSGTRGGDDEGDLFDSGTLAPGATFTFTFEDAGSFEYFCSIHSGMDAEVTVIE